MKNLTAFGKFQDCSYIEEQSDSYFKKNMDRPTSLLTQMFCFSNCRMLTSRKLEQIKTMGHIVQFMKNMKFF